MANSEKLSLSGIPAPELRPAHLLKAAQVRGAAMCCGPIGATARKCECVVARVGRYWRDSFWNVRDWTPDLGCPSTRLRVQFDDTGASAFLEFAATSWHWWLPLAFSVTGLVIAVCALRETGDVAVPISAFAALWIGIPLFAVIYDRRARRKDADFLACIWREAMGFSKTVALDDDASLPIVDSLVSPVASTWPQAGGSQGVRVFSRQLDVSSATRVIDSIDPKAFDYYHVASDSCRHVVTVRGTSATLYRYMGRCLPHVRLVMSTSKMDCKAEVRVAGLFQLMFTAVFLPIGCATLGVAFVFTGDPIGGYVATLVCFIVSLTLLVLGIRRLSHVSTEIRHLREVVAL